MLALKDIRDYISGYQMTGDSNVYIGKLDNKKQKSIGVYNRKQEGKPVNSLGGLDCTTYGTRSVSLLIHWSKSQAESEAAAYELYEKLRESRPIAIGDTTINFISLQVPEPVDVGTDDNGVYEYVIWLDFIYNRETPLKTGK